MEQYLIDNNIISGYFGELFSENMMLFIGNLIDATPNVSIITEIEALSWVNTNKQKEKIIQEFILDANIINLNAEIVAECVKIRRGRKIKTPDAIIAATAIVNKMTLISTDKDFKNIQNLKLINPKE